MADISLFNQLYAFHSSDILVGWSQWYSIQANGDLPATLIADFAVYARNEWEKCSESPGHFLQWYRSVSHTWLHHHLFTPCTEKYGIGWNVVCKLPYCRMKGNTGDETGGRGGGRIDPHEVLNNAWLSLYRFWARGRPPRRPIMSPTGFYCRYAIWAYSQLVREEFQFPGSLPDEVSRGFDPLDGGAGDPTVWCELLDALRSSPQNLGLDSTDVEILLLRVSACFDDSTIAQLVHLPENSVRQKLSRAFHALRKWLR